VDESVGGEGGVVIMVFHWFISGAVVIGVSMFWLSSLLLSLVGMDGCEVGEVGEVGGTVNVDVDVDANELEGVPFSSPLLSVVTLNPRCCLPVEMPMSLDKGD